MAAMNFRIELSGLGFAARILLRSHAAEGFCYASRPTMSRADEAKRCHWAKSPAMRAYHDKEWGVPLHDDRKLFEFLILEGAQAGLSWETILNKRANYRRAFDGFDAQKIAGYDARKVRELLKNAGIVRNRLKIRATIANAQAFLTVKKEFGSFDRYIWQFAAGRPRKNERRGSQRVPTSSPESDAMSKDLKRRGFRFVGSTICYAFMQAVGMVNDHARDCFRRNKIRWSGPTFGNERGLGTRGVRLKAAQIDSRDVSR
jgi:DNA-3-methyladenine glycosylase I